MEVAGFGKEQKSPRQKMFSRQDFPLSTILKSNETIDLSMSSCIPMKNEYSFGRIG